VTTPEPGFAAWMGALQVRMEAVLARVLPAAGLAPAPGQNLGFHDDRDSQPLRRLPRAGGRGRDLAGQERQLVSGEDLLAAELLELHAPSVPDRPRT